MKKTNLGIYTILFLGLLGCIGCGGKNFEEPGVASASSFTDNLSLAVTFDEAWEATNNILNKYPILNVNKREGTVETDWILGKSESLYSGYSGNRIPYNVRFKFVVKITAKKGSSNIRVTPREQFYSDIISLDSDVKGSIFQWNETKPSSVRGYKILTEIEDELKRIVAKK